MNDMSERGSKVGLHANVWGNRSKGGGVANIHANGQWAAVFEMRTANLIEFLKVEPSDELAEVIRARLGLPD